MYALKRKDGFSFFCTAKTLEKHEELVREAFWRWHGLQAKGSDKLLDDFMAKYERVIVNVEPYN